MHVGALAANRCERRARAVEHLAALADRRADEVAQRREVGQAAGERGEQRRLRLQPRERAPHAPRRARQRGDLQQLGRRQRLTALGRARRRAHVVDAAHRHVHPRGGQMHRLGRLALTPHDRGAIGGGAQRQRRLAPGGERDVAREPLAHRGELDDGQRLIVQRSLPARTPRAAPPRRRGRPTARPCAGRAARGRARCGRRSAGRGRAGPAVRASAPPGGSAIAHSAVSTPSPGSEPPPIIERPGTTSPSGPQARAQRRARRRSAVERRGDHAPHRDRLDRLAARVVVERGGEAGDRGLVEPHRARQRVPPHRRDRLGRAHGDARLRPAEQLVAGEQRHVRPRRHRVGHERLRREPVRARVEHRAAAEVVEQQQPALARERREAVERRGLGEADDAEVRGVDAQQRRRLVGDRLGVVAEVGAVRRADLDEARAGLAHDVGDAEPAPDLDELPARDDDLAPGAERRQREQQRGGVVVDRDARLRPRHPRQRVREVVEARAARARREVELQVRVARRRRPHRLDGRAREGGASEVGVDHDARRVDHAPQRRFERPRALGDGLGGRRAGRLAGAVDGGAVLVEHGAADAHERLAAVPLGERRDALVGEQPVDRGQGAVRVGGFARHASIVRAGRRGGSGPSRRARGNAQRRIRGTVEPRLDSARGRREAT